MISKTINITVLLLFFSLMTLAFVHFDTSHSTAKEKTTKQAEVTENISLYSNGKLIGEWKGIGRGTMDGNTYTFTTEKGAYANRLRIKGDFIVETVEN